jgi:hypothetical protein
VKGAARNPLMETCTLVSKNNLTIECISAYGNPMVCMVNSGSPSIFGHKLSPGQRAFLLVKHLDFFADSVP